MMKRYKIGVIGAPSLLGRNILKTIIEKNFPYSFIRAISSTDEKKEIKVDDYQFSLTNLSMDSIKDLDIVFIVLEDNNINNYLEFLEENNKYVVIADNLLNQISLNAINVESITKDDNILKCPLVNSIVLEKIFNSLEIDSLEIYSFHSAIEHGDSGFFEINQQYIDYFNYKPLIARVFPNISGQHIPLAFNLIPFNNNLYEEQFKDEVYSIVNNISSIRTCDFYIPSFYSSAIQIKVITNKTDLVLDSLKNNKDIKMYEDICPTLLDSEGTNFIHIGNLKSNENELCFFATFDIIKMTSKTVVEMMEKRISYDNI